VGCARATHDDGKNVDVSTRPLLANGNGEEGIFVVNHVCGVGEVVLSAKLPFPILIFFIEEYRRRPFVWLTNLGLRSRMKSGLCAGGLNTEGSISSRRMARHGCG
jgi:hypothetical protein